MARTFTVSRSIVVEAPASLVYDQVSRPAQMGRWSPENLGATLADADADAPARVGQVFEGHNKRGPARWTTRCTVTEADPGTRFAFRVHAIGLKRPRLRGPIATWEYRFEETGSERGEPGGATRVTETWTDDRRAWPTFVANAFDRIATRGHTFAAFQAGNIDRTLRNLKKELDGAASR
ncbi:SRPBCC family protein [Streptomyces flavofungini]|uniref:SRPBCC family protein n=1 Tax=Streptomyces flavofungini TaxID=68200 RepID=UPI0034DEC142